MKSASELVSFALSKLGTNYVYGMKGAVLTQAKYDLLKKTYGTDMVWDSDASKVGTVCVDCSGLPSWFSGIIRNSANYKATATKVLPISQIEQAVPGCLVWRIGHIGVYIGNGEIVEARGSAYGVVRTKVSERDFSHVIWGCDFDYTEFYATSEPVKAETVQQTAPASSDNVEVLYQTYIPSRWLPEVNGESDYAGVQGKAIQGIKARLSSGSIRYRAHIVGGGWLPWVTDDSDYAGTYGKNVDLVQMELIGSSHSVEYRVAAVGKDYYSWVRDLSDYAGSSGKAIDRLQIRIV